MSSSLEPKKYVICIIIYKYIYILHSVYISYIYTTYTNLYSSDSTQRRLYCQHLGDGMLILSMTGGEISKGHDGSALMRAAGGPATGYKVSNGLGCSSIQEKLEDPSEMSLGKLFWISIFRVVWYTMWEYCECWSKILQPCQIVLIWSCPCNGGRRDWTTMMVPNKNPVSRPMI